MAFEMRSDEGLVGSPPPGMVIRDQLVFFTSSEDLAFLPDESVNFEREELPVRHELT